MSLRVNHFPEIKFTGTLRPSQAAVAAIAAAQLAAGERELYIVAPPGSGKTVIGLYLWAACGKCPALVLSPNSAIQAQWCARLDLFSGVSLDAVSDNPARPALFNSLTYQAVTMPRRAGDIEAAALTAWQEQLMAKGAAGSPVEAERWIAGLRDNNPGYYQSRLSVHCREARERMASDGKVLRALHGASMEVWDRLRQAGIGMLILDECHHLVGYWGEVLAAIREFLPDPLIVGLTATPPDLTAVPPADAERYRAFFGPVDFEVPVPAVVKDGFLAPYQDLAYFVRPTAAELAYVAGVDRDLHCLVDELNRPLAVPPGGEPVPPLAEWLARTLAERQLPTGPVADWEKFARRDPALADQGRAFLLRRGLPLPPDVPAPSPAAAAEQVAEFAVLVPVLDRYIRHCLRRAAPPAAQQLAEQAIKRLRLLGVQVTETGTQACASPVSRVMAYSRAKAAAVVPVLRREQEVMGAALRAVVIADFERSSAVSAELSHLFDDEAGGAVAAFRALLSDPATDELDPVLVTGSTVLVDDDLAARFLARACEWLTANSRAVTLSYEERDGFNLLLGGGADWSPRVYVAMITDLFQEGVTRCLVGTRGLLGEGWDAIKLNVMIDLTTVTTDMTVNQLRGRSIRLDPDAPDKLADNWDVVCIAPEFTKGLDDYARFLKKHTRIFGVTDDGAVEKGAGHVHPAFTELKPEGVEDAVAVLNEDMLRRAGQRALLRGLWKIGQPYRAEPVRTVELKLGDGGGGFPPFAGCRDPWHSGSLAQAVGTALLHALQETKAITIAGDIHVGVRAGGYVRMFLEDADAASSALFADALREALGPFTRARYVIPRYLELREETWLSRALPDFIGQYFKKHTRQLAMLHAVPKLLARDKATAAVYQKYWNRIVSPGQAVYALHGKGEELVSQARERGLLPVNPVRDKDVFM